MRCEENGSSLQLVKSCVFAHLLFSCWLYLYLFMYFRSNRVMSFLLGGVLALSTLVFGCSDHFRITVAHSTSGIEHEIAVFKLAELGTKSKTFNELTVELGEGPAIRLVGSCGDDDSFFFSSTIPAKILDRCTQPNLEIHVDSTGKPFAIQISSERPCAAPLHSEKKQWHAATISIVTPHTAEIIETYIPSESEYRDVTPLGDADPESIEDQRPSRKNDHDSKPQNAVNAGEKSVIGKYWPYIFGVMLLINVMFGKKEGPRAVESSSSSGKTKKN